MAEHLLDVPNGQPGKARDSVAISTPRLLEREESHHGYKSALDGSADYHARPLGVGGAGSRAIESDEVPAQADTRGVDMTTNRCAIRREMPRIRTSHGA